MPNDCMNRVYIKGNKEKIAAIAKAFDEERLLEHMVPPPKDMFRGRLGEKERAECAEKGIPNWHDWQCDNWGTKWDTYYNDIIINEPTHFQAQFFTAWSPPLEAFDTYLARNPDVGIDYYYVEYGCGFIGAHGFTTELPSTSDSPEWEQCPILKQCDEVFGIREEMMECEEEEKAYEEACNS